MNRVLVALIFSSGARVGGGTVSYTDNADSHLTFAEPLQPHVPEVLSAEAAALYPVLDDTHFKYVRVFPRGVESAEDPTAYAPVTRAAYSVPSLEADLPNVEDEHWSITRSETIDGIRTLTELVIFPAAIAKCPGLGSPRYPTLSLAQVEWVGVAGNYAEAMIVSKSLVQGLPTIQCRVDAVSAPAAAMDSVRAMKRTYLIPAVRLQSGLR